MTLAIGLSNEYYVYNQSLFKEICQLQIELELLVGPPFAKGAF